MQRTRTILQRSPASGVCKRSMANYIVVGDDEAVKAMDSAAGKKIFYFVSMTDCFYIVLMYFVTQIASCHHLISLSCHLFPRLCYADRFLVPTLQVSFSPL